MKDLSDSKGRTKNLSAHTRANRSFTSHICVGAVFFLRTFTTCWTCARDDSSSVPTGQHNKATAAWCGLEQPTVVCAGQTHHSCSRPEISPRSQNEHTVPAWTRASLTYPPVRIEKACTIGPSNSDGIQIKGPHLRVTTARRTVCIPLMDTPRAPESTLKTLDLLEASNVQKINANTTRTPTPRTDLEPTKIAKPRTQAMHRAMTTAPSDVTKQTFMPKTSIRREEQTTRSEKDARTMPNKKLHKRPRTLTNHIKSNTPTLPQLIDQVVRRSALAPAPRSRTHSRTRTQVRFPQHTMTALAQDRHGPLEPSILEEPRESELETSTPRIVTVCDAAQPRVLRAFRPCAVLWKNLALLWFSRKPRRALSRSQKSHTSAHSAAESQHQVRSST